MFERKFNFTVNPLHFWKITDKSSSSSSLPSLSVSLLHRPPPPHRRSPWLPAATTPPYPHHLASSSPARRSPDPAGVFPAQPRRSAAARIRHVVLPAASSCSPLARDSSWSCSASRSPPRLLFTSSLSSPLDYHRLSSAAVLLAAVSRLRRPMSATQCSPSTITSH
jgi:hypothetical protein